MLSAVGRQNGGGRRNKEERRKGAVGWPRKMIEGMKHHPH
jgi:hypothetical protein